MKIVDLHIHDLRFPTSQALDGSDAIRRPMSSSPPKARMKGTA
jgi:hypothetical protein